MENIKPARGNFFVNLARYLSDSILVFVYGLIILLAALILPIPATIIQLPELIHEWKICVYNPSCKTWSILKLLATPITTLIVTFCCIISMAFFALAYPLVNLVNWLKNDKYDAY